MVALLSQEWLDKRTQLVAGLPERPGASARVQHVVTGAPDGQVAYVDVFEDGRLTSTLGSSDDVDVTFTETFADAVAIARGELDLHVGFMRGQVKFVGDVGALMRVLPVTQSEEHRAALLRLAEQTDA
ncbi:MAG: SCP2 sterol-binding domain-containing protein [Acidimicrobiales bacterium]